MIGGTDVVLEIGAGVRAADAILRAVRRHWPRCVYQNADDESAPFTPFEGDWPPQDVDREFFVYKDEEAARSWDADGATPENDNTMLYVIVPEKPADRTTVPTLTVVCGEPSGEVKAILDDIESSLKENGRTGNGASIASPGLGVCE
ncbi:MAG TPA: hypothetical protein VFC46_00145 [Humisphaera sp.]|nr:hypothetical protein [Humisphaera sp.]